MFRNIVARLMHCWINATDLIILYCFFFFTISQWSIVVEAAEIMLITAQCESRCIYQLNTVGAKPESTPNALRLVGPPLAFQKNSRSSRDPESSSSSVIVESVYSNTVNVNENYDKECYRDASCLACAKPCSQPFSEYTTCMDQCKSLKEEGPKVSCLGSCAFLRDITTRKVGTCPSIQQMSGFALACIESCHNDNDCNGIQKCCPHRCGRTCQYPETINEIVPPKPTLKYVTKNDKQDDEGRTVIHLAWKLPVLQERVTRFPVFLNRLVKPAFTAFSLRSNRAPIKSEITRPFNSTTTTTLYVVQSQINLNNGDKGANGATKLNEWKDIAITNHMELTLKEYLPTSWIRFRVASINPNGTLGFSDPSNVITIKSGISAPSMPKNLTVGEYSLKENGKIGQVIHWSAPKSDLPIVKYKVTWSSQSQQQKQGSPKATSSPRGEAGGEKTEELLQFKKIVLGTANSFTLDDLEPDSTYFIQVQAYSQKGPLKFKGERASIFLTTPNTDPNFVPKHQNNRDNKHSKKSQSSEGKGTTNPISEDYYEEYVTKLKMPKEGGGGDKVMKSQETKIDIEKGKSFMNMLEEIFVKLENITIDIPYLEGAILKTRVRWDATINSPNVALKLPSHIRYKVSWHPTVCIDNPSHPNTFVKREKAIVDSNKKEESKGELTNSLNFRRRAAEGFARIKKITESKASISESDFKIRKTEGVTSPYKNEFVLYDLKFKCRYEVRIEPFHPTGGATKNVKINVTHISTATVRDYYVTNFQTPNCRDLKLTLNPDRLAEIIDCPISIPIPSRPRNVTFHIVHIGGRDNISALLSWRPPAVKDSVSQDVTERMPPNRWLPLLGGRKVFVGNENYYRQQNTRTKSSGQTENDPNVIGYRMVFYGKRGGSSINRVQESISSEPNLNEDNVSHNIFIKVFSPFQTSFYITDLLHDRDYAVDVQAFSEGGPGPISHLEFRTPKEVDEGRLSNGGSLYDHRLLPLSKNTFDSNNQLILPTPSTLVRRKSGFTNFKEPQPIVAHRASETNRDPSAYSSNDYYPYFDYGTMHRNSKEGQSGSRGAYSQRDSGIYRYYKYNPARNRYRSGFPATYAERYRKKTSTNKTNSIFDVSHLHRYIVITSSCITIIFSLTYWTGFM